MRDNFITLENDEVQFLPTSLASDWYAGNKDLIKNHLLVFDGLRPLVYPRTVILTAITTELLAKKYMLDTLYDTMGFDYNPIWNVDGTETLTYTRENTGTVRDAETINESTTRAVDVEETHTGTDANAHTGTTTTENEGTDTTTHTGTETEVLDYEDSITHGGTVTTNHTGTGSQTHTGTDANAHTGTVTVADDVTDTATTSKTAYNDNTFVNAEKVVDVTDKDTTTTYNETTTETRNLTDGETRNFSDAETINTNDLTEKDSTNTKTLNTEDETTLDTTTTTTHADTMTETRNLTDVRDEDATESRTGANTNLRTDDLTEEYTETRTRGGNIGVTSTQSLIEQEREVARFSFIEVVCKVITDAVCMGVYDCD